MALRCHSYVGGECTWGACMAAPWVRDGWGNAKDWWREGGVQPLPFAFTLTPTIGAVAVYAPGGLYDPVDGHVAVVVNAGDGKRYQVQEMNFARFGVYDLRWTTLQGIEAFILPPGVVPDAAGVTPPAVSSSLSDRLNLSWADWQWYYNSKRPAVARELAAVRARADAVASEPL